MEKEKLLDIKDLSVTYKTEDGIVYAVNNLNLTLRTAGDGRNQKREGQ